MLRWLEQNAITLYHSTPTLYRTLLPHLRVGRFTLDSLRFVVLGGEEVRKSDIEDFQRYFPPQVKLINGYGPSECTLAMQNVMSHETVCTRKSVALGRAVEGVKALLISENREVTELYDTGEIILESAQLAVGYWRQPALTSSKFVANQNGSRRYHTGDLGRLLPGGEIEYAGRIDARIKIRGYSIAAAEVENAALEHPDIAHAAAVSSAIGDQGHLVLYVVAKPQKQISSKAIQTLLRHKLPLYMIPSQIVITDSLPLTVSGKIDRQTLERRVETAHRGLHSIPKRAWTKKMLGKEVRKLWSEIFERPVFSESNFFRLGGDSLTATNILIAVEEQFRASAGFDLLFNNPTPKTFAAALLPLLKTESSAIASSLRSKPRAERPLSFSQMRYWQRLKEGADPASFNVCIRYNIDGFVDLDVLRASLTQIMRHHDVLRTVISSSVPRRTVLDVSECPLTTVDYSSHPDPVTVVENRIRSESALAFSLDDNLLVRFLLLKIRPRRCVFLLVQHHLVTDSRSRQIFEHDMNRAYRLVGSGGKIKTEQTTKYDDFVHWQRELFYQSQLRQKRLRFWASSLRTSEFVPCELPTNRSETKLPAASSDLCCSWSGDLMRALHKMSTVNQVTMFAVMMAAFKVVLFSHSRQPVICITTDFANRMRPAWKNVYGLFADVLILTSRFSPHVSFFTFVVQVQKTIMDAMEKQYIPFADLMDQCFPGKLGHYDELFPVGFFCERSTSETSSQNSIADLLRRGCEVGNGASSRPLLLSVYFNPSEIHCILTYRCRMFTSSAAARILEKLGTVICTVAKTPNINLEELAKC